jgi:hypothetical protein
MLDKLSTHLDIERTKATLNGQEETTTSEILSAYHHISELLDFIHKHFNRFISRHRPMARHHAYTALNELREAKALIETQIPASTNPQLEHLLFTPFNTFINCNAKRTWHLLYYCQHIYTEFKQLPTNSPLIEEDIIWTLFKLNYNSHSFYTFITGYIRSLNNHNYLEYLYTLQCKVRQTVLRTHLAFEATEPALNKLLENWLKEEIDYLKNISLIRGQSGLENNNLTNKKVLAHLSVAELAYLFKILAETNLLAVPNHSQFFESLTQTYRTKNSDHISSNSIRAKFYKPEPGVRNAVKKHLIKLLNHINLQM